MTDTVGFKKQDVLLLLLAFVFGTAAVAPAPNGIALGVLIGVWLFTGVWWSERHMLLRKDWFLPLVLCMLLPWMGLMWTPDLATGLADAKRSVYWIYGLVAATVSYRCYSAKLLITAFLAGLFLSVSVSILQFFHLLPLHKGQDYGFLSYITYSLLLVAGMLFLAYLWKEQCHFLMRFAIAAGMVLLLWNLLISNGRSGYLACLFAVPWIFMIMASRRQMVLVVFGCLLGISVLSLSPVVRERVALIARDVNLYQQGQGDTSIGLRLHMWKGAVKIWMDHPILGVGTGGYLHEFKKIAESPAYAIYSHPHNSLLYVGASYGAVGLALFTWLVVVVFLRGWRARENHAGRIILVFLFVIGVGSLTDTQIMGHVTGMLLGVISGLRTE